MRSAHCTGLKRGTGKKAIGKKQIKLFVLSGRCFILFTRTEQERRKQWNAQDVKMFFQSSKRY
jgi:hypothetical protein